MLPNMTSTVAKRIFKLEDMPEHFNRVIAGGYTGRDVWVWETNNIISSKVFLIDDALSELLHLTDNKEPILKLPFKHIWLEKTILINGFRIEGLYLTNANPFSEHVGEIWVTCSVNGQHAGDDVPTNIQFTQQLDIDFKKIMAEIMSYPEDEWREYHLEEINRIEKDSSEFRDDLFRYVKNFLNVLNHPEIETVTITYNQERIDKRVKRGQLPIREITHIRLTGRLKEYVDNIPAEHNGVSHRFWVRGHFMRFRDRERFRRLYSLYSEGKLSKQFYLDNDKETLMRWKLPYIKGHGELIEKIYSVESDATA